MLINKRIMVTGAGGFIGSHLVEKLIESGAKVKALVHYNSRNDIGLLNLINEDFRQKIDIILCDLNDYNAVLDIAKNVEIIFHLGALIAIPYSYIHPRQVVMTNINSTLNVMMAARECPNVERIIHTSSSEVYGSAQYVPMDEKHPLDCQSPYAASKVGADKIAESFYKSFNIPVSIIRPFNCYGPRQSARAVIPTIISQALNKKEIHIGSTFPTRDYTYCTDTVDAMIAMSNCEKAIGEVVNAGSGFEISIAEIIDKVFEIIGYELPIVQDNKRIRPNKSEVDRLFCDNTKAKKLMGWENRISFDNGLKMTIKWVKENIDFYDTNRYII